MHRREGIQEIWSPGTHAGVGGVVKERGTANLALRWMTAEARSFGLDIKEELIDYGSATWTIHPSEAGLDSPTQSHRELGYLVGGEFRQDKPEFHPIVDELADYEPRAKISSADISAIVST